MTTLLPKDADNNIIPALRYRDGGAHVISVSSSSARNSVAFNAETKVISLFATVPVHINFGGSAVSANTTHHYFPAGVYYDVAISGGGGKSSQDLYIAAIRAEATDGVLYISEKE